MLTESLSCLDWTPSSKSYLARFRRSKWDQAPTSATSSGLNEGYGGSYSAVDVGSGPQASNSSGPHSQVPASDAASRAAAFLSSTLGTSASASASAAGGATGPRGWVPPGHPDFVAAKPVFSGEVNINGCRPEIRYTMTSRETFDMIEEEYGATVITRGTFKQSEVNSTGGDWSNLAPEDKPLHLYVTADSQDKVDRACTRLKTLLERPSTVRQSFSVPSFRLLSQDPKPCSNVSPLAQKYFCSIFVLTFLTSWSRRPLVF